jgi:hypothetical protein
MVRSRCRRSSTKGSRTGGAPSDAPDICEDPLAWCVSGGRVAEETESEGPSRSSAGGAAGADTESTGPSERCEGAGDGPAVAAWAAATGRVAVSRGASRRAQTQKDIRWKAGSVTLEWCRTVLCGAT